jgi:hypothetical protein
LTSRILLTRPRWASSRWNPATTPLSATRASVSLSRRWPEPGNPPLTALAFCGVVRYLARCVRSRKRSASVTAVLYPGQPAKARWSQLACLRRRLRWTLLICRLRPRPTLQRRRLPTPVHPARFATARGKRGTLTSESTCRVEPAVGPAADPRQEPDEPDEPDLTP